MSDNLIEGINPLIISNILWFKGKRYGPHPSKIKYLKKKHPIGGFFGLYNMGPYDRYYEPYVKIYGADGSAVRVITCKSNDHAFIYAAFLRKQLNDFLSNLKVKND
jgi:hypothetical protein